MGSSKSGPEVPDLNRLIGSQVGGNIGLTRANNVGTLFSTSGPYGRSDWTKIKGGATKYTDPYTGEKYKVPKYEQSITLSPEEQQKYDLSNQAQIGALGKANELMESMGNFKLDDFDFTKSLGEIGGNIYDPNADRLTLGNEATEKRLYDLGSKRIDPDIAREEANLASQLSNQGIQIGSAAWNTAMGQQGQRNADRRNQLLLTGRGQAASEQQAEWQSRLQGQGQQFGQALANRGRELAERGQYAGEQFGTQDRNIQYLTQLLQAGQPNMPQFTGSQPGASPYMDYAGAINTNWDQQFKKWQQESANKGNMFGGAMSGLAGIIGSDERIKDNIKQVGKTAEGLPIYEFSIGDGEMQTGVMAQDVEQVNPGAVVENASGIKGVDYPAAVGDGTGTYVVQPNDNIWKIGERLGVDPQVIIEANPQLRNPDIIQPGDQLVVPGMAAPSPAAVPLAAIPPGGPAAVVEALSGPVGPGTAPPGAMPAAPMTEPVSAPPPAAAGGLTPDQMQTIMELKRRFPDLQLPTGGMGAY